MGLDMYLKKELYIGSSNEEPSGETVEFHSYRGPVKLDKATIEGVTIEVMYWRKANWIHRWFVENVQNGKDDCEQYEVSYEKLIELYELCVKAYLSKDEELFPSQEGFFFGGDEKGEYYWHTIFQTMEALKPIVNELKKPVEEREPEFSFATFSYRASW